MLRKHKAEHLSYVNDSARISGLFSMSVVNVMGLVYMVIVPVKLVTPYSGPVTLLYCQCTSAWLSLRGQKLTQVNDAGSGNRQDVNCQHDDVLEILPASDSGNATGAARDPCRRNCRTGDGSRRRFQSVS